MEPGSSRQTHKVLWGLKSKVCQLVLTNDLVKAREVAAEVARIEREYNQTRPQLIHRRSQ